MTRQMLGELISEAIAVVIIVGFGDSVAAMCFLYDPSPYVGAYWGRCISWGFAVTLAIYATGSVSGTRANPAVKPVSSVQQARRLVSQARSDNKSSVLLRVKNDSGTDFVALPIGNA